MLAELLDGPSVQTILALRLGVENGGGAGGTVIAMWIHPYAKSFWGSRKGRSSGLVTRSKIDSAKWFWAAVHAFHRATRVSHAA